MNTLHLVDSFTQTPFHGNPAAVCILSAPAPEAWMQKLAAEMNLSETAFAHPESWPAQTPGGPSLQGWRLRWFTPTVEVALCGHATLATAHVLWETGHLPPGQPADFITESGRITCNSGQEPDGSITMDFPATPESPMTVPRGLPEALGCGVYYAGRNAFDFLIETKDEETVRGLQPDLAALAEYPVRGIIVTARAAKPGTPHDFVSRFFAPASGVNEDPVTGSAHCCLGPFWSQRLGRNRLTGRQVSRREGTVGVEWLPDRNRVILSGHAVTVLSGRLAAPALPDAPT